MIRRYATLFLAILLAACAQQNAVIETPEQENIAGGATQQVDNRISVYTDKIAFTPSGPTPKTLDITATDTAIYQTGYYNTTQTNRWTRFNLTGSDRVNQWLIGNADTTLSFTRNDVTSNDTIQIIIYTCTWTQGQWNCHGNQWQEIRIPATKQSCPDNKCFANGACYDRGQTHPSNGSTCTAQGWKDVPSQDEVTVTVNDAVREDQTEVSFSTSGFDLQQHPYHLHFTTGGQTVKMYNGSSPVTISTTADQVCAYVANRTHGQASEESCTTVDDTVNEDELSVNMTRALAEGDQVTAYFDTTGFTPSSNDYHVHFTANTQLITMHFSPEPATLDTGANEVCAVVADADHNPVGEPSCATVTDPSVGEDLWSDPATWGGDKPDEGDTVTITKDMTVRLDETPPALDGIKIQGGTLKFARKDVNLTARYIKATDGAKFQIGTESRPFQNEATMTLTGTRDDLPGVEHCGTKGLCALGAKLDIHGSVRGPTHTQLADGATARPGDTSITVAGEVEWEPGDEIVIVSTDYDPGLTEKRTITNVDDNTVSFDEPLQYEHYSNREQFAGATLDQRAEVIHLTRNIKIQGDKQSSEDNFGAHVMAMNEHHKEQMQRNQDGEDMIDLWQEYDNNQTLTPELSGVEFERVGQEGVLARYPFHWHLYGNASSSYIEDSSIHDTFQRCVTVHGTHEATVRNNVAFNATGHCYFLEDGAEAQNKIINNVASLVHPFSNGSRELIPSDSRPAGIWLRNINNKIINNTVAGVFGYGIWVDSRAQGTGNPTGPSATEDIDLRRSVPVGEFYGNTMHSIANVWRHPNKNFVHENTVHQTDQQTGAGLFLEHLIGKSYRGPREFPGFTAYHNDGIGLWAASRGAVWINDSITADVPVGIKARARTNNITVVGDTANDGNPLDAGSGLVPNEFSFEKTWYSMTLDDLHYYENRTDRSLPAYMGLGLPRPDDLPFVGQENFYTGTVSKGVTYVNFQDDGIINYTVFHTAPSPEAEGHWHWNTAFENAEMTMRPNVGGGGNNPAMFTMIDGDGSISGDGDYTEYRYYQYYDSLAAHQAPQVEYRGEMRKRNMANRLSDPVEDVYITDDCERVTGSPRLWKCESKTGFFTLKPQPWGQEFFSSPTVEDDSTGETFTDNSVHSWLPVNNTYHYRNDNLTPEGFNIALSNVHTGDWLAFSFPADDPFNAQTEASVNNVNSLDAFYNNNSASVIMYHDDADNIQYIKTYGWMSVNDKGVPVDKTSGGARFR